MTLDELKNDKEAMQCIREFFTHPAFPKVRIAFTNHTPRGDDKVATSVKVAHGQNLGTRYVFNQIETLAGTGPTEPPKPPRPRGGRDPDLDDNAKK